MAAIVVVIKGVSETILLSVQGLSPIGKKEVFTRGCAEQLPAKCCQLINAKPSIKAAKLVAVVHEIVRGAQQANEGIALADVALQSQDTDTGIPTEESLVRWICSFGVREIVWVARVIVRGDQ